MQDEITHSFDQCSITTIFRGTMVSNSARPGTPPFTIIDSLICLIRPREPTRNQGTGCATITVSKWLNGGSAASSRAPGTIPPVSYRRGPRPGEGEEGVIVIFPRHQGHEEFREVFDRDQMSRIRFASSSMSQVFIFRCVSKWTMLWTGPRRRRGQRPHLPYPVGFDP